MMQGLRSPADLVIRVIILLCYGCPIQAIVHAYGLDERTVADWQQRAGKHCHQVHQAIVEQGKVETHHVQADEIRAKGRKMVAWMGMALDATSRVCLAGVVGIHLEPALAHRLLPQTRSSFTGLSDRRTCPHG